MKISVIIPHLNQPEALERCLASLRSGSRSADEIIVVDNGSTELPRSICDAEEGVLLLQERDPGPGPARNTGIAASSGDVLACIDADCIADSAWLEQAEAAITDPDAEILGGDVRIALANPPQMTGIEAYESIFAYRMDRYIARQNFTGTGNLVVRRHVFEAVGPFAGIGVAEDRDWGHRATKMGFAIRYVPDMRVYHPARKNFAELARKWERQIAHDFSLARQRPGGRLKWVAKLMVMWASPIAEVPRILGSDRVAGLWNRMKALAYVIRIRWRRFGLMIRAMISPVAAAEQWNRPDK